MKKKFTEIINFNSRSLKVTIAGIAFALCGNSADAGCLNVQSWSEVTQSSPSRPAVVDDLSISLSDNSSEKDSVKSSLHSSLDDFLAEIEDSLKSLPITDKTVKYMEDDPGLYFDIRLEGEIRLDMSVYLDDDSAYFNIWEKGKVSIQDSLPIDRLIKFVDSLYGQKG